MEYIKKNRVILFFIALVVLYVVFWMTRPDSPQKKIMINGREYAVLVADSTQEWERGLMNRRSLSNVDGMVFEFPDKQYRMFWNKNTLLDLDVYWMNNDTVLGNGFLPSIERSQLTVIRSPYPVSRVVEVLRNK